MIPKGRAKGGVARAKVLSPERRSEIAKQGALARWGSRVSPRVKNRDGSRGGKTCSGNMVIDAKQLQSARGNAERCLKRARDEAASVEVSARNDPFNGWAVHSAVEKKALADGYERAMNDILGLLDVVLGAK